MFDLTINYGLLPVKLMYILYYAGLSCFIPFKSLYQKQLGMSAAQNGLIQAIMQIVSLFSPPLAGIITDKTKAYKFMLASLMFFSIVFTIPFYFVPAEEDSRSYKNVSCCHSEFIDQLIVCPPNNFSRNIRCSLSDPNLTISYNQSAFQECKVHDVACLFDSDTDTYGLTFGLLVLLTILMSFFLSPVTPLIDSSVMDTLGRDDVGSFGFQRLWGAVGFGVAGLSIGYITDYISPYEIYGKFTKNYSAAFIGVVVFWGGAICVMITSLNISAPKAKGILKGLGRLLVQGKILFFLLVVLVSGFATGVQYSYLFWYLSGFSDFKQYILGLTLVITCASEIPMFWISGKISEKLGYVTVLSIGLCAAAIRFFAYSVITQAVHVLAIEWLHGISFALPTAAMCSYATVMAPKDAVATLISLSQAVYWGIGNMLGALVGGLLYHAYGGQALFRTTSAICFMTALLYWICYGQFGMIRLCKRNRKGNVNVKAPEDCKKVPGSEAEPLNT